MTSSLNVKRTSIEIQ